MHIDQNNYAFMHAFMTGQICRILYKRQSTFVQCRPISPNKQSLTVSKLFHKFKRLKRLNIVLPLIC